MTTTTYELRPHTVEARRYTPADHDQCTALHRWLGLEHREDGHAPDALLEVATPDDDMTPVHPGDWIVEDGAGLTVLANEEFHDRYQAMTGDES